MRLKRIGVSLLLILGSANIFAEPGGTHRGFAGTVRVFQAQSMTIEKNEQPSESPYMQQPHDRRRGREIELPPSSGYSMQGETYQNADNMRRHGRLTPEERRALRRQIDEAGHDIYAPKR